MRLNSVQTSNLSMDLPIPLMAISQVEVLKGSGSTLYGSDATAGVLHIITKPPETTEVKLRAGFGLHYLRFRFRRSLLFLLVEF